MTLCNSCNRLHNDCDVLVQIQRIADTYRMELNIKISKCDAWEDDWFFQSDVKKAVDELKLKLPDHLNEIEGVFGDLHKCPSCGSSKIWFKSKEISGCKMYLYFECIDCGKKFRQVYSIEYESTEEV